MRSTLWVGLISVAYNLKSSAKPGACLRLGQRFQGEDGKPQQKTMLSGVLTGNLYPEQWGQVNRYVDFYDLKGDVEMF